MQTFFQFHIPGKLDVQKVTKINSVSVEFLMWRSSSSPPPLGFI